MSNFSIGRVVIRWIGNQPIRFMVVDPECPTMRNRWPALFYPDPEDFLRCLAGKKLETVLVTPTDPVHIVVVESSFPKLKTLSYSMFRWDFDIFYNELAVQEPQVLDWKYDGF